MNSYELNIDDIYFNIYDKSRCRYIMSRARQPPLVTGISPNEGAPWTKVTIRGENLGTGPADLVGNTHMHACKYKSLQ